MQLIFFFQFKLLNKIFSDVCNKSLHKSTL